MSRSQKEHYERLFREADADGSGSLSIDELVKVMRKNGFRGPNSQIEAYFKRTDTSGDGQISMEEFLVVMGVIPEKDAKEAAMRYVFKEFDKNGDGKIDQCELKKVFEEMNKHFSYDEVEKMIKMADENNDGFLDYEEFVSRFL